MYVRVNREQEFGFWEIDLYSKKAYFRENSFLRDNIKPEIIDYTKLYNTVSSFLQSPDFFLNKNIKNEHGHVYVKVIIKNRKTIFGFEPYCMWYKLGVDAHDPNTMLVCEHHALIIDHNGNLLCGEHANATFKKKFLPQD